MFFKSEINVPGKVILKEFGHKYGEIAGLKSVEILRQNRANGGGGNFSKQVNILKGEGNFNYLMSPKIKF